MTATQIDLDATFGPLLPPQRSDRGPPVQQWERDFAPDSLSKLDAVSAISLQHAMNEISNGWKVGRVLAYDTIIIWLMDKDGELWFALEELVLEGVATGRPKHQRLPLTALLPKLGHPALNNGAQARIAGELYYDVGLDPPRWVLNNNSGRFGRHPSRFPRHLDNVAAIFQRHRIVVKPHFRPS